MRAHIRIIGVATATAALVAGSMGAATAGGVNLKDRRHDVIVGPAGGHTSAKVKTFARQTDVTALRFTVGVKYVSMRVTFAQLKRSATYSVAADIAEEYATLPGFSGLAITVAPGGASTVSTSYRSPTGGHTCGDPGTPAITTTVTYGKNGNVFVQMPFDCIDLPGVNPRVFGENGETRRWRARATVNSSVPGTRKAFADPVSRTKAKQPSWTRYVFAG